MIGRLFKNLRQQKPRIRLELAPHQGALPVFLGFTRAEIIGLFRDMGIQSYSNAHGSLYFVENAVQVEFDNSERASFIGIAPHREIELLYRGTELLRTPAEKVFEIILKQENDKSAKYNPYEHLFEDQIITLWDADPQYDLSGERYAVWGQIGLGNNSYLEAVKDSHDD